MTYKGKRSLNSCGQNAFTHPCRSYCISAYSKFWKKILRLCESLSIAPNAPLSSTKTSTNGKLV